MSRRSIWASFVNKEDIDNIIIHDAARPFVTVENIDECISALDDHDGAMPVLPMKDIMILAAPKIVLTSF